MTPDPYEEVAYPGFPFPQTHPDRLFLLATLHGVQAARPERCRFLELGCGDGINAVTVAAGLPGATVVGLDRAAGPLARGRAIAAELGMGNVELQAADLLAPGELGVFDYVVAHGVYSWVPERVREALLDVCARVLAPNGVAFVSYNALPGAHLRRAARDLLRFHAAGAPSPPERVARAREAMAFVERFGDRADAYGRALEHEIARMRRLSANSLLHDDLGDEWAPQYLTDVVAAARARGLEHLADAELAELRHDRFPPGVEDVLREVGGEDPVRREQYGDFLAGRPFRQTLFVPAAARPASEPVAAGLAALRLSLADGAAPDDDRLLGVLAEAFPATLALDEVSRAAGVSADTVASGLLGAFRAGRVELWARAPTWTAEIPPRPAVSPLARLMAREGTAIPTLDHGVYRTADPVARRLLTLMDGSRDRTALLEGLLASVGDQIVAESDAGEPVPAEALRKPFAERLDEDLATFARAGLIVQDPG